MRFEVRAALAIGLLLPILETCRRGLHHWLVDSMTMLEDYLAGALLLFAAIASYRGRRNAHLWTLLAWAAVAAMMTLSFWRHVELTLRGAEMEPHNGAVLLVKSLLWLTCMVSLVRSFAHARAMTTNL
jgi:uncharacterized membrane protein YjfL (UPF0719 family)